MTSTESVKKVINRILGYEKMNGGGSESESSSSSSTSSSTSSFGFNDNEKQSRIDNNNNDSDNSTDSKTESIFKDDEKLPDLKTSESDSDSSDSIFDNSTESDNKIDTEKTENIPNVEEVYKYVDEQPVYKASRIIPSVFISSRIENRDKYNEFLNDIHEKFPSLSHTTEKGNCETKIVMRHIFRQVNKNFKIEDNQDELIEKSKEYLNNMPESEIDIEKFSEIDKSKEKSKKLFINMLYKIHKLAPELSFGDPRDGNVYDTMIIRSAAYRICHEKYPDLPRLEFSQKVYDMITPEFIQSINIEEEKEKYLNYMENKKTDKADKADKKDKKATKSKKVKK